VRLTLVTWLGDVTEMIGATKDGVWPEAQIRQTDGDTGADRAPQTLCPVFVGANSQQSSACAIVVISNKPMHSETHHATHLREPADRHWLPVMRRKTSDS